MKKIFLLLVFCLPALSDVSAVNKRLNNAAEVLSDVMDADDKGIPLDLVSHAQCVVLVPGLKSGAFGIGAEYGKGFFSCRKGRAWSAPASIRIEGGSFGFQIGGIETDLILLVMNPKGASHLLADQFTLGSQGQVAAGPLGRSTTSETDATMRAEMLSWSRSRGVFAGISLKGTTLRQNLSDNAAIYGRRLKNKQIIYGNVAWPDKGRELLATLNKFAARAHHMRP